MTMTFCRLRLPVLLTAATVALAAAGCGSGRTTRGTSGLEKTQIVVGTVPTASSGGLYVAQQQGFFRQAGLHVTIEDVASGDAATVKLVTGGLDILNGAYVGFILAQAHGLARFHVVADGYAGAARVDDIVAAKGAGITSPQQLKGKTIAVNALNSVAQLMTDSALSVYGIKPSQVKFVVIPFPNMLAALKTQQVDAAFLPEPYLSQTEVAIGGTELLDVNQGATQNFPIAGYVSTAKWFAKYPKTAAAFAHAIKRGQAVATTNRAALETALMKYTTIDRQSAAIMSLGQFPTTVDATRLQRVANVMRQFGVLRHPFNVADMTQGTR